MNDEKEILSELNRRNSLIQVGKTALFSCPEISRIHLRIDVSRIGAAGVVTTGTLMHRWDFPVLPVLPGRIR